MDQRTASASRAMLIASCFACAVAIGMFGARLLGWTDIPPILPILLLVTGIAGAVA